MDRRKFIQTSSLAAAGMMALPSFLEAGKKKTTIGLQLYTLRDVIMKDVKGTLSSVAAMGYTQAETYGYNNGKLFGMTVKEFGAYMKSIGMKTVSGHYGIEMTTSDSWNKACEDAKALGQGFVVVPWLDKKYYSSLDELKKTCETLNKAGEVAKKHGLQFGYHNHAFELEKVEGQVMMDYMLGQLDSKLVAWEMDIYWVVRGGSDPVTYFEKYPGRFQLWHVKDMDKMSPENNADVGTGSIDFKNLFAKAKQSGLKNFFVEQETYPSSPMESTKNCANYLKTIL
jgi:sugar phosphate isomerase/epimerase